MSATTVMELLNFYKIAYAHTHTATDYTYTLNTHGFGAYAQGNDNSGVIEIGIVEENPIIFKDEKGECHIAEEGDIFIIPPMRCFGVTTKNPGLHRHITTEALIDCRIYTDLAVKPNNTATITLPLIIEGGKQSEKIASVIRKIVNKSSFLAYKSYFGECSDFMLLMSEIKNYTERLSVANAEELSPSCKMYCKMAEKYAVENLSRTLKLEEIAAHVGISKNYLTNIFSKYKGMPLSEYINRMKLNHMLELMLRFGYNVRQAGEYIGIDNVNYISRMFKKYYGVTLSEYRRNNY